MQRIKFKNWSREGSMHLIKSAVYVLTLTLIVIGCGKGNSPVQAPAQIQESFKEVIVDSQGRKLLALKEAALHKEYLLQSYISLLPEAALPFALKSRIVSFVRQGDKVYMLEATNGHTVSNEIPQSLVLAQYDVSKEHSKDGVVAIDFNGGHGRVFLGADWWGQDFDGDAYSPSFFSIALRNNYLRTAEFNKHNQYVVKQVAQLGLGIFGFEINDGVEISYVLQPYRPDSSYKLDRAYNDYDKLGFFESNPILVGSKTNLFWTRHHTEKPIIYAISSNTPELYKDAVREGILYWNQALKKTKIQVIDAPSGATMPDPSYNLVQWYTWDSAPFAYAQAHVDPRTGQILNSQVYMTSVFAFHTKALARKFVSRLKAQSQSEPSLLSTARSFASGNHNPGVLTSAIMKQVMSLAGFKGWTRCGMDASKALERATEVIQSTDADDAAVLRASQDIIRAIVAHEVGHTLGLRHNFAGSLGAENYPLKKSSEIQKRYLKEAKVEPNIRVTSSVMDYLPYREEFLAGHLIKNGVLFDYDKKAIDVLYNGKPYITNDTIIDRKPWFCTDSQREAYADCLAWDAGRNAVENMAGAVDEQVKYLPYELYERFIDAKEPLIAPRGVPVQTVSLPSPQTLARRIMLPRSTFVSNFMAETGFLQIRRLYDYINELNKEEVLKRELEEFVSNVNEAADSEARNNGGMAKVFSKISGAQLQYSQTEFNALVDHPEKYGDTAPNGKPFSFNATERSRMKEMVGRLYGADKLPEKLALEDQNIWRTTPSSWKYEGTEVAAQLETLLADRVQSYVFDKKRTEGGADDAIRVSFEILLQPARGKEGDSTSAVPEKRIRIKNAKLPKYYFSRSIRSGAPAMLSPGWEDRSRLFGVNKKAEYKRRFESEIRNALKGLNPDGTGQKGTIEEWDPSLNGGSWKETDTLPEFSSIQIGNIEKVEPKSAEREVQTWIQDNQLVKAAF